MLESIDTHYTRFVKDQERFAKEQFQGATNHDIYQERLTDPENWPNFQLAPYSMYFYYVRINADGRLVIDHYFFVDGDVTDPKTWKKIPHDKDELCNLVTTLAINARPIVQAEPRERKPPRLRKGDLKKTKWRRVSYIAIFFDEGNWSLLKRPTDGSKSAITFIVNKGGKQSWPNHSFFDAIDLDIKMPIRHPGPSGPPEDTRSAIVFVNHLKRDEDGNDLGYEDPGNPKYEEQDFLFEIIVNVNAEMSDDPPTVVIIDPGGTNGGPSVPPPPE